MRAVITDPLILFKIIFGIPLSMKYQHYLKYQQTFPQPDVACSYVHFAQRTEFYLCLRTQSIGIILSIQISDNRYFYLCQGISLHAMCVFICVTTRYKMLAVSATVAGVLLNNQYQLQQLFSSGIFVFIYFF